MSAPGSACTSKGSKVVDLWGGVADPATNRPYGESTLQLVFSTTKGATAACANLLMQRGQLDIDAPVVTYWPEFGTAGKENIPVRWLLCHKAGLPIIDKPLSLAEVLEWDPVVAALSVQEPVWEPGTAHGYHALTYGWLVGEVVRRVDGRSLGTFFAEEIAEPLGLEFWIGLPESQEHRVAPLIGSLIPVGEAPNEELRALLDAVHRTRLAARPGADSQRCVRHGGLERQRRTCSRDRRRERRHECSVLVALLRRPGRSDRRRAGCAVVLGGADRRGTRVPDQGRRPLPVLRDELRSGLLHRVAVRARTVAPGPSGTRVREDRWGSPTPTTRSQRAT